MSQSSDVVVTGIGPVTAIGSGCEEFWQALIAGKLGVGSLQRRDDGGPKPFADWAQRPDAGHWVGAPIVGFDGAQHVRPRKAMKVMGRELQTAFAAAAMANQQAGVADAITDGYLVVDRIATVFGSQMFYGPVSELQEAIRQSRDRSGQYQLSLFGAAAMREIMPLWMLKYLPNMPACHVGISIGATGANNTIVSGDVSSTSALIEAVGLLRRGIADLVVCGGSGNLIDSTYLVYRGDAPVPEINDPLELSSRPHTREATGVVGGEAAASLVIERADIAANRGATPLAVVAGSASRFSAAPRCRGGSAASIGAAIEAALSQSGLNADRIGLVVSHGMGHPSRDAAERQAVADSLPSTPLVMPIGTTGHCGAAIGAVYLVVAVLALVHRTLPPSFLHGTPHAGWEDRFTDSPKPLDRDAVLVLTHTSQGIANAVVLRTADHAT